MKTNWNLLLVMALFYVSLVSCGKNIGELGDPDGEDIKIETSMTAEINGVTTFSSDDANVLVTADQGAAKAIVLGAEAGDQDISIHIFGYNGLGTYTEINNNPNYTNIFQYKVLDSILVDGAWQFYNDVWSTNAGLGNSGIIEITEETNTYVNGTFSFRAGGGTMTDSVFVRKGTFHARK